MQKELYKGRAHTDSPKTALGIELGVNTFLTRYRAALPAQREALGNFK